MLKDFRGRVYMATVHIEGIKYEMKMLTFTEVMDWLKDDKVPSRHKKLMLSDNPELKIYYEG